MPTQELPYGRAEVVKLFEDLARSTWNLLATGHEYHCIPSEETLTDLNLLHLARSGIPFLKIIKASKFIEGQCGFDWEWWIGSDRFGWLRYVIQAKKLNLRTDRYTGLRQRTKGKLQLDVLKDFARCQRAIPLYCFYNFIDEAENPVRAYWTCYGEFEAEQLGCTLASLDVVERALKHRKAPSALTLHTSRGELGGVAIPWRCMFSCARRHLPLQPAEHSPFPLGGMTSVLVWTRKHPSIRIYGRMPSGLGNYRDASLYASSLGGLPRRIMVLDSARMEGVE